MSEEFQNIDRNQRSLKALADGASYVIFSDGSMCRIDVPKPQPGAVVYDIKNDWDDVSLVQLFKNKAVLINEMADAINVTADEPLVISKCQACGTTLRLPGEFCDNPNCEFAMPK